MTRSRYEKRCHENRINCRVTFTEQALPLGCRHLGSHKMERVVIKKGLVFVGVLLLGACGGGGKSSSTYKATVMTGTGGTVSPATASVTAGSTASFVVTPAEGYSIKSVAGCSGSLQGANFVTGKLSADCTINAEFARNAYQVDVEAGSGGSVALSGSAVLYGDTLSVPLTPEPGYQVEFVTGCGLGTLTGNTYVSAPIKSACKLVIQFAKKRVAVYGMVAEGKPLANAWVEAKCQGGSGFAGQVKTDSKGEFAADVPEMDLPCALRADVTDPFTVYHSLVVKPGRVNITPFTDLVLTLATNKLPRAFYFDVAVAEVLPQLPAAQERLLAILAANGYKLPTSEFKPFDGNLVIGDAWDLLLDQYGTGLAQTLTASHEGLIYDLLASQTHRFPLPNGDQEITAETCFNPVLYQPDTQVVIKRYTISVAGEAISQNLHEYHYDNQQLIEQGDSQQLLQRYQVTSCFSSDLSLVKQSCWTGVGHMQRLVNLNMKTDSEQSLEYEQDNLLNSPDQVLRDGVFKREYSPAGSLVRYRFPAGVEYKETFETNQDSKLFTKYSPAENLFGTTSAKTTRTSKFVGIKTLNRGGKSYDVCEFNIAEQKTVLAGSTNPETAPGDYSSSYVQYFLVGAGVDVTDTAVTSIAINGTEVYSNPKSNP